MGGRRALTPLNTLCAKGPNANKRRSDTLGQSVCDALLVSTKEGRCLRVSQSLHRSQMRDLVAFRLHDVWEQRVRLKVEEAPVKRTNALSGGRLGTNTSEDKSERGIGVPHCRWMKTDLIELL